MKALGIILAGGNSNRMKELSKRRAVPAMPIAGSFRCIDFALSNMTNSHIQRVAVIAQYNAGSITRYLSSSKWWDFGRKQGGLYTFTPTITSDNNWWYRGTADAMYQNIEFLTRCHEPYVIISDGDCIYKLDYNKILDYHVSKKADITVVCKQMPQGEDLSRFGVIRMDDNDRIYEYEEKPMLPNSNIISAGIYVLRRRQLIEMLEKCSEEGRSDFVTDILVRYKNAKQMYGYMLNSYWSNIATIDSYYKTNMDFLQANVRKEFFKDYPKIYSKIDDLPPAKYNTGSDVRNSLITSGCIINSKVENSVLFKKVFVGKNCVIKNSIILNDVYIGDNTHIENCIVESKGTLKANTLYSGENGITVVQERNTRYNI